MSLSNKKCSNLEKNIDNVEADACDRRISPGHECLYILNCHDQRVRFKTNFDKDLHPSMKVIDLHQVSIPKRETRVSKSPLPIRRHGDVKILSTILLAIRHIFTNDNVIYCWVIELMGRRICSVQCIETASRYGKAGPHCFFLVSGSPSPTFFTYRPWSFRRLF